MKTKNRIPIVMLILFSAGTGLYAGSDSVDARPYIGVLLDSTPLPALLVKHLGLSPDQGVRIKNVHKGGPADKAGLERDDIIIGFEGGDVADFESLVDRIRHAGVGAEVSMEIIHLGQRKSVTLTVEALEGEFDFKYPPEPEVVQSWRPGKIFRLKPGDENWMEVLKDGIPPELDVNIRKFLNELELYTFYHSDGEDYMITIEGPPDDDDSTITVQADDDEYKTTLGELDQLPEKYRESAEQDVKNARKAAKKERFDKRTRRNVYFRRLPDDLKSYLEKIKPHRGFQVPRFLPDKSMFEKIQKQMKELQRRLDRLEKRQQEPRDSKKSQNQEPENGQKVPLGQGDKKSV